MKPQSPNELVERYRQHKIIEGVSGEHRLGDAGQLALALVFLTVWAINSFVLRSSTFLNEIVPLELRIPLGALVLSLAGYLSKRGLKIVFGEKREKP